jgi:hypothetical protein
MMGEKLLRSRHDTDLDDHDIGEIIRKLTSELYFHGHPINRKEARDDVGLPFVVDATPAVADAMWELFSTYDEAMRLNDQFQPLLDAIKLNPLPIPSAGHPPAFASVPLDTIGAAYVESVTRCDVFEMDFEVTLQRDPMGVYQSALAQLRREWTEQAD